MKAKLFIVVLMMLVCVGASNARPLQDKNAARDATREKLSQLLAVVGPKINVSFRQSEKQPYNFVGVKRDALVNTEAFEIIIAVTTADTIGFRVYPHYKGGYINLNKAKDANGLMRRLLNLSDRNFLFWGADATDDVFAGYTLTLESGFPSEAIGVVLNSIAPLDKFVGDMRTLVDGGTAQLQ